MEMPAALAPFARYVQVQGRTTFCYDTGPAAGVPLVFLHGLGDEADTWRHVFPLLGGQRCIALDLPGFGRSDALAGAASVGALARAVLTLLDALNLPQAVLVGSSLGAAVAQRVALAQPARVESLVLLDGGLPIAPATPPGALWTFLLPGVGELAYSMLRFSEQQAYETLRPYYANMDALPQEDRAFLRTRVVQRVKSHKQRNAFLSALRWLTIEQRFRAGTYRAALASLTIPTRIIWGDTDRIVPRGAGEAMATLLPDARFAVIENCGHLPQQERPSELIELLRSPAR